MTDEVLESYLQQYLAAQRIPHATIAWQGGEPTLGPRFLPSFYRAAVNSELISFF